MHFFARITIYVQLQAMACEIGKLIFVVNSLLNWGCICILIYLTVTILNSEIIQEMYV
jgi:hypothetical protein